jgi:hypothetical protein
LFYASKNNNSTDKFAAFLAQCSHSVTSRSVEERLKLQFGVSLEESGYGKDRVMALRDEFGDGTTVCFIWVLVLVLVFFFFFCSYIFFTLAS